MAEDSRDTISSILHAGVSDIFGGERLVVDIVRDLVKDEVKKSIKEALEKNPKLKKELQEAIKLYVDAKIREMYATIKIAKVAAKLGVEALPDDIKDELSKEIADIFEREISSILERAIH